MQLLRARLVALILALAATAFVLAAPAPAAAVPATEHGIGHLWQADGRSWIGSYRLADGRLAFCLQAGAPSPLGNDYTETDAAALGVTGDTAARVAELTRRWAGSHEPDIAAAAQLAIWSVTGLNGRDPGAYASRANGQAGRVRQLAAEMLATVDGPGGASRGATATLDVELRADGTGTVVAQVVVDYLAGGPATLPPGAVSGVLELTGAATVDGSTTASLANGVPLEVTVPTGAAVLEAAAAVRFTDLPFGAGLVTATSPAGSQNLVLGAPVTVTAEAAAERSVPSDAPFQPVVTTQTSAAVASAGAQLTDRLEVTIDAASPSVEWPVVDGPDGRRPVEVTIRSRLLGPFFAPPVEADAPPSDAQIVCEVVTVATAPGTYDTPPCVLPDVGYYVWVETIGPDGTATGGEKVLPWQGRFGVATETTLVPFAPLIETVATPQSAAVGDCVADRLTVSRLNPAAGPLEVDSILWGPFEQRPAPGSVLDPAAPQAGRVTTTIPADGEHTTLCIPVNEPGHYVFTYASAGSADGSTVPVFEDRTVHESETVTVREELAETGPGETAAVVLALAVGTIATGAALLVRRRRGAHSNEAATPLRW
ncbi:thioester domain-containing protein [Desertivibrio insolitus]|uniref:thioester domain-containing protein n=1 Tax=Herbiconiux sp. SYSU D00978 TaxID=2812562 RepID=UPI001A97BB80|nr:thioester domain-containing protein [Herbiconiux sp. SYSU D00978]